MGKKIFLYIKEQFRPYNSLFVISIYSIFSLIFTWPLVKHMNDAVAGHPYGEMWSHLWGLHWVKSYYLKHAIFPIHSEMLNYPYGASLFFIDPLSALFSIPLQMFLSLPATYNLLIIINLIFGAYACFLLADYFFKSRIAAFYSGAVYAFSAYYLSYISTGTSETFNIGWIPLFLYFFARMLFERKMSYALYSGITLFLITFSNFYYAEFTLMFVSFILIYYLFIEFYKSVLKKELENISKINLREKIDEIKKKFRADSPGKKRPIQSIFDHFHFLRRGHDFGLTSIFVLICAYRFLLLLIFSLSLIVLTGLSGRLYNPDIDINLFYLELLAAVALFAFFFIIIWREFEKQRSALLRPLKNYFENCNLRHVRLRKFILLLLCFFTFLISYIFYSSMSLKSFSIFGTFIIAIATLMITMILMYIESRGKDRLELPFFHNNSNEEPDNVEAPRLRDYVNKIFPLFFFGFIGFNVFCLDFFYFPGAGSHFSGNNVVGLIVLLITLIGGLIYSAKYRIFSEFEYAGENGSQKGEIKNDIFEMTLHFLKNITKKHAPSFLMLMFVSLLLIAPYLYIFETTLRNHDSVVKWRSSLKGQRGIFSKRTIDKNEMSVRLDNSALLVDYVRIGKRNVLRKYTPHFYVLFTYSPYVGFLTLILCIYALFYSGKDKYFWFWLTGGILFLILSLGPFTNVTRNLFSKEISPLYGLFYSWFPLFSKIHVPYRLNLCVMLCFAVVAGYGVKYMIRNMPKIQQNLVVMIFSVSLIIEIIFISPAPFPVELCKMDVPEFYLEMAYDRPEYGIIVSPVKKLRAGFYYQIFHKKGTPLSLTQYTPDILSKNLFILCLYNLEGNYKMTPNIFTEKRLRRHLEKLKKSRIKYIVVYNNHLGASRKRVHRFLSYFLGKPRRINDNIYVYRLYLNVPEQI